MLYLGYNQPAEAWQDLLTCHRLGRQVGQGGTLIEGLVGIAIEQLACRAEVAFLDRAKPDAKTVEGCLRDLFALPKSRTVAEQIDLAERIWYLDSIMQFDRNEVSQEHFYDENLQPYKHGLSDEASMASTGTRHSRLLTTGTTGSPRSSVRKTVPPALSR